MKRLISAIFALLLILAVTAACATSNENNRQPSETGAASKGSNPTDGNPLSVESSSADLTEGAGSEANIEGVGGEANTEGANREANTEGAGSEANTEGENPKGGNAASNGESPSGKRSSYAIARDSFKTNIVKKRTNDNEIADPPEGLFDLVYFPSDVGGLAAYISCDPKDGQKHPLIIWLVGGWENAIGGHLWETPDWDNEQTASAYREAGILMMYPSFRGSNGNPGYHETMYGEINDIVSAYEYAATLPYVDPDRIYLGGHSTGGTRALLAAEYTDAFRAVIAFGPWISLEGGNTDEYTFDPNDEEELKMRSPIDWLYCITTPTFIIEGSEGNAYDLDIFNSLAQYNSNINVMSVDGKDHFNVLAPVNSILAQKILQDTGNKCNITLDDVKVVD
jgi:alpha/beta superfamily hydrolase